MSRNVPDIGPSNPPPIPPQPLDYGGVRTVAGGFRSSPATKLFSLAAFLMTSAVMLILLAIFIFVVPRLETGYADFGTNLPLITRLVLGVGRLMQTPIGWVSGVIVVFGVAGTVALLPLRGRWLRLILLLLLALVIIGLALAVLLPILNLMESISSNPGKL